MKIGLEVHTALPTHSKLFCACSTEAAEPNTAICPVCMGFPGSKPVLNRNALEISLRVSAALHCSIIKNSYFIRKVYFYPDLPKSYQITQLEGSVGHGGYVDIGSKKIRIRRVQLEEDPARIIRSEDYSLLDFNRSGVPLNEIVTEPDIASEEELRSFVSELRSILYYVGIDIDKEVKIDLNISLGEERVEVKNVTGIKNLIDAARFEKKRQSDLLQSGKPIVKETRSYSAESLSTVSSREKESDEEYGFIFDPDLSFYPTSGIALGKPVIASEIASSYGKYSGTVKELIMLDRDSLRLLEYGSKNSDIKNVINAIELLKRHRGTSMPNEGFGEMLKYMDSGLLPNEDAISALMQGKPVDLAADVIDAKDIDDEINRLISERPQLVSEYKANKKAFNFIVGMILKKHRVDPKYVSERLSAIIGQA